MDERIFKVLAKLETLAESPLEGQNFWNVSPETGKFLNILTQIVGARAVLEIGTSNGYSGLWFAEALSHTGGKLYTVESHRGRFELARKNFEEAGAGPGPDAIVTQIFGHAPEVFADANFPFEGTFDLIFLDATKMEYESYLEAVWPLLRPGGIFVADNMISHQREVAGFLHAVRQNPELTTTVLSLGAGLLVAGRTLTGS